MTLVKPSHASGTVNSIPTYKISFLTCTPGTPESMIGCFTAYMTSHGYSSCSLSVVRDTHGIAVAGYCIPDYMPSRRDNAGVYLQQVASACPANSALLNGACICNNPTATDSTNYMPDITGTSCASAASCPVDKLTTPPFIDACSTSLEQGKGVDVNNACGTLREPDMAEAASCIATKINAALTDARSAFRYTNPSATIRTTAYQNHLLEIWDKSQRLNTIMNSVVYTPETKQACAPRYVDVNNEITAHGIDSAPSPSGRAAPHVEHRAIDIPRRVAKALIDQVTTYTTTYTIVNGQRVPTRTIASDVEDYMHSATDNPPACDSHMSWGGRFDPIDRVHFQLP